MRPACAGVGRGLRRLLALDFQAGAAVLFIHWRVAAERRGGAGDLAIIKKNKATAETNRLCSTLSRQVRFQKDVYASAIGLCKDLSDCEDKVLGLPDS